MSNNSLAIFTKAAQLLVEADTIQKTKELKSMALTALEWAKRKKLGKEAEQYCYSYAMEAERKMGEMLLATERASGGQPYQEKKIPTCSVEVQVDPTLTELGISRKESSEAQFIANLPEEQFQQIRNQEKTIPEVKRETKRTEIIEKLESIENKEIKAIKGVYDVIVIDPPWEIQKIERDITPNQIEFDYPTMTIEEIKNLKIPYADDCHIFLWTTQKYLPIAFDILKTWDTKYICTFVWHKPGGFQPFDLPQYNCEFCLYAHKGAPKFIDTKDFSLCFNADRKGHSIKPDFFYEMVKRVTAGRRLDMFNRREIGGFDVWGLEAK